jgi:hypothetical protein
MLPVPAYEPPVELSDVPHPKNSVEDAAFRERPFFGGTHATVGARGNRERTNGT